MKRCPTCTRTFLDEQLSYCTDDGTPLVDHPQSSSFDPQATVLNSAPPMTKDISEPQPTRPFRADEMPGGFRAPHAWSEPSFTPAPVAPPPAWGAPAPPPPSAWNPPSPPPPAAWAPPPPRGAGNASRKTQQNPVAIASLAVGVFSLTIGLCCYLGTATGPIAIVLGVIAMVQLKNDPSQTVSKGMAIAGIATGAVAFVLIILLVILRVSLGSWT